MKTRVKVTEIQKYQNLSKKLSNPSLVNELISKYQNDTKNAVQNILNMCKTIKEIYEKVKLNEITIQDLNYFCATVNLDKNSPTFRKYMRIADKAELFEQYLAKVPASYTVLYEIATLSSEQFETLIESNQLNKFITLKEVRQISGKVPLVKTNAKLSLNVSFDMKQLSNESLTVITECCQYLRKLKDVELDLPNDKIFMNALMKKAA